MPPALRHILHKGRLFLRIGAPEDEHYRAVLPRDEFDHRVRKLLPAALLVRSRLAHFHRQHAVEQQNALLGPMGKVAMARRIDAEVRLHLLVDVDKAWRWAHAVLDGEAEAMGLPFAMIGVLPQYDDADLVERGQIERTEIFIALGEDALACLLFSQQEFAQIAHDRRGEHAFQWLCPTVVELWGGSGSGSRRRIVHGPVLEHRVREWEPLFWGKICFVQKVPALICNALLDQFRGKAAQGPMSLVTSLHPIDDLAALEMRWRSLEAEAEGASFFLGWTWIGNWLAALEAASLPLPQVLAIQEGGRDVALALFGRGRALRKLGGVPALWLNESGDAEGDRPYVEYNGLLCAAGRAGDAYRAMMAALERDRRWSALYLAGVEDEGLLADMGGIRRRTVADSSPAYHVDLAAVRGAGGGYLSLLSSNTRSQIRRSLKDEAASPVLERAQDEATALAWLAQMAQFNVGRHEDNAWDSAFFRDFARRLVMAGLTDGSVELLQIGTEADALGYLLNFVKAGRVMNYQSAFAQPRTARSKPGLMCHATAIEHHAELGAVLYSFLAGKDRYKQSLSTGAEKLYWLVLERFNWRLEAEALARRLLRRPAS